MKTRGRPRHPDILTPRQWEVLELVRQGLTNEEIAQRLGITLDGAKFHVSDIIRKLGVDSRYEAAAWQPSRPSWIERSRMTAAAPLAVLRRVHWNAFTYTAGATATIGVIAATALLAWGVTRTQGDGPSSPMVAPLATSPTPSALTGIPPLDATIAKLTAHDIAGLVAAAQFTPVGCSSGVVGIGDPPKCPVGVAAGTPIDAFPVAGCEGTYILTSDSLRDSFTAILSTGANNTPAASPSNSSSVFAVTRSDARFALSVNGYIVVLTPGSHPSATGEPQYWNLTPDGRIVGFAGGCGLPGAAQDLNFQTPNAAFVVGPFISCSPPPGDAADVLVHVDGILGVGTAKPMFWGPARTSPDQPPLEDRAIVEVTASTRWITDYPTKLEDARPGMVFQASGRVQDDCTILADTIDRDLSAE